MATSKIENSQASFRIVVHLLDYQYHWLLPVQIFLASIWVAFCENRGGLVGTLSNLGYEIYGDAAVLRGYGTMFQLSGYKDEPYAIRLEMENSEGIKPLRPRKFPNIYQQIIQLHAQSIIDGKPLNAEDGLRNLRACFAIHKSARNGGKAYIVK